MTKSKKIDFKFEYIGSCVYQANFDYDLNWFQKILVKLKLKKRPYVEIISIKGIDAIEK